MDEAFLSYYNEELKFIRQMSGEFAKDYPKVAGRLSLDAAGQDQCADPFIERLLEGVAFLTARVRQKQDSEFPNWTQAFFESVYPGYPTPLPSIGIVKVTPTLAEADLASGMRLPRATSFRSKLNPGDETACIFKTAHDVSLYPLAVQSADYYDRTLDQLGIPTAYLSDVAAAVKLNFRSTAGSDEAPLPISEFELDVLDIHLRGNGAVPVRILEYLLSRTVRILVRPLGGGVGSETVLDLDTLTPLGIDSDQALLPCDARVFEGYRLLREYFACPARFRFIRLAGLYKVLQEIEAGGFEILFLMEQTDDYIQKHLDVDNFDLFCVPVINLFEKRLDRIDLSYAKHEYIVVPDKTKPYDFEVYTIQSIEGIGRTSMDSRWFYPFYRVTDNLRDADAFYTTRREVRRLTATEERIGRKSSYLGSQLFVSLVDKQQNHFETSLRQLSVQAWCTNRHLPLSMARAEGSDSDFEIEYDMVETICFNGSPTRPKNAQDQGTLLWRMINQLHSNYHSIIDDDVKQAGQGLRDVLSPFAESIDPDLIKQIDALVEVNARPITRRVHTEGPASFVRGQEIELVFDESVFGDSGIFVLGQLISEFLRRYVMINAFVETVLVSRQRGEIKRWKPKTGIKQIL